MKVLFLPVICVGVLGLTSCGLVRTATQLPGSILRTAGRTIGLGLENSEVETKKVVGEEVKFERISPRVQR